MDKTIVFWRDLIGLPLTQTLGSANYRAYTFSLNAESSLVFFEWDGAGPIQEKEAGYPVPGARVFDHLCLAAADEDHLWEVKDRLAAAGVEVTEAMDHGRLWSVYAFDPNGINVELGLVFEGLIPINPWADPDPTDRAKEGGDPVSANRPRTTPTPREDRIAYPGLGDKAFHKPDQGNS